jgi:ribose 5-phosphate isomerase B
MRVAIAADHNGYELKRQLSDWLREEGHEVDDRGVHGPETVDYPHLCLALGRAVVSGEADRAIMIGGTGSGEQVACNKIDGIRASLCHQEFIAEIARAHNDSNVLVVGAKVVAFDLARRITDIWMTTDFKGGRHQRRLEQIEALERGEELPR